MGGFPPPHITLCICICICPRPWAGSPLPTSLVVFVFVLGHGRVPPSPHHLVDWHEAASTAANGDKVITIVIVCSS